ncbi:MAG TPA: AraC family transcriptional regulator [Bacteroidia bacterium]|nr:AraC family transcriptional regulator [Bacteroidia bacterium]
MSTQTIKIMNMCCDRCIMVVKQVLAEFGIKHKKVGLGYAVIYEKPAISRSALEKALKKPGFEIIRTKEEEICEKMKIAIHKIFFDSSLNELTAFNLKSYMESQTGIPYKKLTAIFSKETQTTIEKYFIRHRIEKAKAIIESRNYSFSEIAFRLGYNSLSHLSRQFKEIEGCSMHDYKQKGKRARKPIDRL